jgi:uncharacterized protein (DUF1778 family)
MAKPPKKATTTMSLHYSVNVSDEDKDLIDRAAAAEDEPKASRWIRKVALRAAREVLGEPKGGK